MGVSAFLIICSIVAIGGVWMISRPNRLPGHKYEADDGPLTDEQLAALRKDVAEHFPTGKLLSRENLFK